MARVSRPGKYRRDRDAVAGGRDLDVIAAPLVASTATVAHAASPGAVLGDLSYQKYDTHALADRQGVSVNVADGNLILQSEDLNVEGTGPALSVTRYFNNLRSGSGQAGNRATLSVGAGRARHGQR